MKKIFLIEDVSEPETWETIEVENNLDWIMSHFPTWSDNIKIYYGVISQATELTPFCEDDLELIALQDEIYIVVYPTANLVIMAVIAIVVAVAAAYFLAPTIPNVNQKNTQAQSPNNELSNRQNQPRPNARIPDPYGTNNVTPDMLAQSFTVFKNHQELEHSYMCIGRDEYEISASNIFDDTTLFSEIAGASLAVYSPFTSPNSLDVPQLQIGDPINTPIETVYKSNSVNGQTLRPPNDNRIKGDNNIRFVSPNIIESIGETDLTNVFSAGDTLKLENAFVATAYSGSTKDIVAWSDGYIMFEIPSNSIPPEYANGGAIRLTGALFEVKNESGAVISTYDLSGTYQTQSVSVVSVTSGEPPTTQYFLKIQFVNPSAINPKWAVADGETATTANVYVEVNSAKLDLNGSFTVTSVSSNSIMLSNPSAINSNWGLISTTEYVSAVLSTSGDKWIGSFTVSGKETSGVYCNFVATNGLFKDNGTAQTRVDVEIQIELTQVNEAGAPIAAPTLHNITVQGSETSRTTRAATLRVENLPVGIYKIRAKRITPSDLAFKGTVVDEVKWRDLYSTETVDDLHFGNVTTIQVTNFATTGALTLKQRKINLICTRKVKSVDAEYNLLPYKIASNRASDIFLDASLDPFIGRRQLHELNIEQIYNTIAEVETYFGHSNAIEFCATLDQSNLSYQETAALIAQAVFCEAYRQGNKINLFFERETDETILLFNHRNILPLSDTHQVRFGNLNKYDGVIFTYTDANNKDTLATIELSDDGTYQNPKEVESTGVRNRLQAYFHAWRIWMKVKNQNKSVSFDATSEGELLIKGHRILVSDMSAAIYSEGYVVSQVGLILKLSQKFTHIVGETYGINLQLTDGTVQNIAITPTTNPKEVLLNAPPRVPLYIDKDAYNDCRYIIYPTTETPISAFIVSERKTNENLTSSVSAYNYSSLYYGHDNDYNVGIIDQEGY